MKRHNNRSSKIGPRKKSEKIRLNSLSPEVEIRKFSEDEMDKVFSEISRTENPEEMVRIIPIFSKSKDNIIDLLTINESWECGNSYRNIIKPGDYLVLMQGKRAYLSGVLTGKIFERGEPDYPILNWSESIGGNKYSLEIEKIKNISERTLMKGVKKDNFLGGCTKEIGGSLNNFCRTTPLLMKKSYFNSIFRDSIFPLSYDKNLEISMKEKISNGDKSKPPYVEENFKNSQGICNLLNDLYLEGSPLNLLLFKPMQSGKTQEIQCFIDLCLGNLKREEILLTSGEDSLLMRGQNTKRLGERIRVEGLTKIMNRIDNGEDPLSKLKVVILDEDQIAQGSEGRVKDLIISTHSENPSFLLIRIGGTPGGHSQNQTRVFRMSVDQNSYRGIAKFISFGQIKEISDCYDEESQEDESESSPYFYQFGTEDKDTVEAWRIKPTFASELNRLGQRKNGGLIIIRDNDPKKAKERIQRYSNRNELDLVISIAHTNPEKKDEKDRDLSIKESVFDVCTRVLNEENVVLIVDQALKAAFDLDSETPKYMKDHGMTVKSKLVAVFETLDSNANSHLQGLPGRCCGYHNNQDVHIYMNVEIAKKYAAYELGIFDLDGYDKAILTVNRTKGGYVRPHTHVDILRSGQKTERMTRMDIFELSFDNYKDELKSLESQLLSLYFRWEYEGMIKLIDSTQVTQSTNKNKRQVGKSNMVKDSEGREYYPNSTVASNWKKGREEFIKIWNRIKSGNGTMEEFTNRRKTLNDSTDKINVILIVDDIEKKILLGLKGKTEINEKSLVLRDGTYLSSEDYLNTVK